MTSPNLEAYLRRATRGLWGERRREVIAELRGSVEARAWKLTCQGFTPHDALETALRELGAPGAIAAGMTGVHTMPRMLKNTLALGLFAAISLTAINSSRAQIEVTNGGTFTITTPTDKLIVTGATGSYFLKYESIKKNLEDAGITVDDAPRKPLDPTNEKGDVPTLRFRFPGSARDTFLQATDNAMEMIVRATAISVLNKKDTPPNDSISVSGTVTPSPSSGNAIVETQAISLLSFTRQLLKRSGLQVRVLGWRNPIIEVGTTKLQIGTEKSSANPREIFVDAAGRSVQSGFPQLSGWLGFGGSNKHAIRVSDPPGTVYAVVTPSPSIPSLQTVDAARVADDGVLYFAAPYKTLAFVKTPLELVRDRLNIKRRNYGFSERPAKALLVKITPELKTSFVLPAKLHSAALK